MWRVMFGHDVSPAQCKPPDPTDSASSSLHIQSGVVRNKVQRGTWPAMLESGLSPLSSETARCPQCGGCLAQKSELRAHQMARELQGAGLTQHTNPRRALLRWGAERRRTSTESLSVYPFFLHYFFMVLLGYDNDGTSPPGSAPGPHSLRASKDGLRFDVFFAARGLLVDSGRRRSSTMLSLLKYISLSLLRMCASLL